MKYWFGIKLCSVAIFIVLVAVSCRKNETAYWQDPQDTALAIFSNTGNNLLTCYANDRTWRTIDRTRGGFFFGVNRYELQVARRTAATQRDTLLIEWAGFFPDNRQQQRHHLILNLFLPRNQFLQNLNALEGKRISVQPDSTGYFTTSIASVSSTVKGRGSVYFHVCHFDSIAPNNYRGHISGLFEGDFTTLKLKNGRFDHELAGELINFR